MEFVKVSDDRTHLIEENTGKPFYFVGANCYYLMVCTPGIPWFISHFDAH